MKNENFCANLNFGSLRLNNLSFHEAAEALENHIKAEQKASDRLVNEINKDNWFKAYCSELLGGAGKPPTANEWMYPLSVLQDARNAYFGKHYAAAQNLLVSAFELYKGLHKRWMEYRNKLILGGERSVTALEVSITILSAVATAGAGAAVTAPGAALWTSGTATQLAAKAAISAGVNGMTAASRQLGSWAQLDEQLDIPKIALDSGLAFVSSLLGGALSGAFKSCMTPKVMGLIQTDSSSGKSLVLGLTQSAGQKFVADLIGKLPPALILEAVKKAAEQAKGKSLTMTDFIELIAAQIAGQSLKSALKVQFEALK